MSTRQAFAHTLTKLPDAEYPLNLTTLALSLDVTKGLLSRYLREFINAGYVNTRRGFAGAFFVTVVDRQALERLANGGVSEGSGVVVGRQG